jgi:hypothetical protein
MAWFRQCLEKIDNQIDIVEKVAILDSCVMIATGARAFLGRCENFAEWRSGRPIGRGLNAYGSRLSQPRSQN